MTTRLVIGIVLIVLGSGLSVGAIVYARKHPRRALRDFASWTMVETVWSDGLWMFVIPPGLILLGIMIILTGPAP